MEGVHYGPVILLILIAVGIVGFTMLGVGVFGIFGRAAEPGVSELCSADSECGSPDVCCFFYNEDSGVCHAPDMCGSIMELTRREKELNRDISLSPTVNPMSNESLLIAFGVLLIALTGWGIVHIFIVRKPKNKVITS